MFPTYDDYIQNIDFIDYLITYENYTINPLESKLQSGEIYKYAELIKSNSDDKLVLLTPTLQGHSNYYIFINRVTGEKGNIITYLQIKGLSPKEINQKLSPLLGQKKGVTYSSNSIPSKSISNSVNWKSFLTNKISPNNQYLSLRGFEKFTLTNYKNIFSRNNEILFPLYQLDGKIVGIESKSYKTLINPSGNRCFENSIKHSSFMVSKNYINGSPKNIILCEHLINGLSYAQMFLSHTNNLIFGTAGQFSFDKIKSLLNFITKYKNANLFLTFDNDAIGTYFSLLTLKAFFPKILLEIKQIGIKTKPIYSLTFLENISPITKELTLKETQLFISEFLLKYKIPNTSIHFSIPKSNDFNNDLMKTKNLSSTNLILVNDSLYNHRLTYLQNKLKNSTSNHDITYYKKALNDLPKLMKSLSKKNNNSIIQKQISN